MYLGKAVELGSLSDGGIDSSVHVYSYAVNICGIFLEFRIGLSVTL